MTRAEHYLEAERLLKLAEKQMSADALLTVSKAQAHATLASVLIGVEEKAQQLDDLEGDEKASAKPVFDKDFWNTSWWRDDSCRCSDCVAKDKKQNSSAEGVGEEQLSLTDFFKKMAETFFSDWKPKEDRDDDKG